MSVHSEHQIGSGSSATVLKIIVLALFAVITAIVAVSFAAHHMRIGFEKEYMHQVNVKIEQLASTSSLLISGDEILADPAAAQTKYASVLPAMLIDSTEENQSHKIYGLYSYSGGTLTPLLQSSSEGLLATQIPVSDWLTTDAAAYKIENEGQVTILTPIKDSQGKVVALYEASATYSFVDAYGNAVERRVLKSVLVAVAAGMVLFSLQFLIPAIVHKARGKGVSY